MLNKINTNERSAMRKTSTEKCVTIPSSFDTKGKDKDTEQLCLALRIDIHQLQEQTYLVVYCGLYRKNLLTELHMSLMVTFRARTLRNQPHRLTD